MATKKQIAEQAMRILSGGHLKPDRTIDIREVMLHLDQLRDQSIKILVWNNLKAGIHEISGDLLTNYTIVSESTSTYGTLIGIELPDKPVDLPNDMGIYQIDNSDFTYNFVRIPSLGKVYKNRNYMLSSSSTVTYYRQGKYIYFTDDYISIAAAASINLTMVVSSQDIAETAEYPLTPDMEADLLIRLVEVFGVMQNAPHDETENNQKNQ